MSQELSCGSSCVCWGSILLKPLCPHFDIIASSLTELVQLQKVEILYHLMIIDLIHCGFYAIIILIKVWSNDAAPTNGHPNGNLMHIPWTLRR